MIAPDSASYPILGAADAAGISYRLALRIATTWRRFKATQAATDWPAFARAFADAEWSHDYNAACDFLARLREAEREGRWS